MFQPVARNHAKRVLPSGFAQTSIHAEGGRSSGLAALVRHLQKFIFGGGIFTGEFGLRIVSERSGVGAVANFIVGSVTLGGIRAAISACNRCNRDEDQDHPGPEHIFEMRYGARVTVQLLLKIAGKVPLSICHATF
jgi:hypothetical protein